MMILIICSISLLMVLINIIYSVWKQSLIIKNQEPIQQFFMRSDQQIASNAKCQYHLLSQQKCDVCKNWFSSACRKLNCMDICQKCSIPDEIIVHLPNGEYTTYYRRKQEPQPSLTSLRPIISQINEQKAKQKQITRRKNSQEPYQQEKSPIKRKVGAQNGSFKIIKNIKKNNIKNKQSIKKLKDCNSNAKLKKDECLQKQTSIFSRKKIEQKQNKLKHTLSTCSIQCQNPTSGMEKNHRKIIGIKNKTQAPLKKQKGLRDRIQNYLKINNFEPTVRLNKTSAIYDIFINQGIDPEFAQNPIKLFKADFMDLDIKCYLSMFNWNTVNKVIFVDVKITDEQFKQTLEFLKDKKVSNFYIRSESITVQSIKYAMEEIINFEFLSQIMIISCVMKIKQEDKKRLTEILKQKKFQDFNKSIKLG